MIIFVRHGKTAYNINGKAMGTLDIPLCREGRLEAQHAAEQLKDVNIDQIFVSPLSRDRQKADIINLYHGIDIVVEDRLKEYYLGDFQGRNFDEIDKPTKQDFWAHPTKYCAQDMQEFEDRIMSFYNEIKDSDKTILVVSHGEVHRRIHNSLYGEINTKTIKNCTPTIITPTASYQLETQTLSTAKTDILEQK